MTILENENYDELVSKGTVLVDFYATWCGPCKMLMPILEEIDKELDIEILEVDVDKYDDLARSFGIMSIPTLMLYKEGEIVKKNVGMMDKTSLIKWIKE